MSVRHFNHHFSPAGQGTSGIDPLPLTTEEIGAAAMMEIVQMSLSASPFTLVLDQLMDGSCTWFKWIGQLGQVRETRTALSGLFGRFVARAYLERYHGYHYFDPIVSGNQVLATSPALALRKTASGDLPDWIISTPGTNPQIAIAEAKGSHNTAGPWAILASAVDQVRRVDVYAGTTQLRIKRFAIATRWAVQANSKLDQPWLCVDDPEDGERDPSAGELMAIQRAIALGHFASLAAGLGAANTAAALERAREAEPGYLEIDEREFTTIEVGGETRRVIAAVLAGSSIIPIPPSATADFQTSVRDIYGEKALLVAIDKDTLARADLRPFSGSPPEQTPEASSVTEPEALWRRRQLRGDGSELIPLSQVHISTQSKI